MSDSPTTARQKEQAWIDILKSIETLTREGLDDIYLEDLRRARSALKRRSAEWQQKRKS